MTPLHAHLTRLLAATLAVTALSMLPLDARAADVAGMTYPPTLNSGGHPLQLNGAGIRHKDNAHLYTAGLYLSAPARTPDAVLAGNGIKQLRVHMLKPISSQDMAQLLTSGLTNNNADDTLGSVALDMLELGTFIANRGKLEAGDGFQIEWSPGMGTTITVFQRSESKPVQQTFEKEDLMLAMLRIWIGAKPADPALKAALLGQRT